MIEVIVIGGGIVGASVAYHAVRAGLRVTLVDRDDDGQATAAGAGIIAAGIGSRRADAYNRLLAGAVGHYPTLVERLAEDGEAETGYTRVGSLLVATSDAEASVLRDLAEVAERAHAAGAPGIGDVSLLDGRQARERVPALGELPGALSLSGTARVDGRLMRGALLRAAQRRGATILSGNAALTRAGDTVRVTVDGQAVPADEVVITAGAWSAALGDALGVAIPVFPQRGQIAHLELPRVETGQWPVVLTFADHYLLTFPDNRVVAGATREHGSGFDYRLTAGGVHQVLGQALGVAPGLAGATLREVRIGFRPASADGLPILGRLPGLTNATVVTGHGPAGLTLGPHAGALIVDLIRGEPIALDLAPYSPGRFS